MFYVKAAEDNWMSDFADMSTAFVKNDKTDERNPMFAEPVAELRRALGWEVGKRGRERERERKSESTELIPER